MLEVLKVIAETFPTLGFPIICCGGLGYFIYRIYQDTTKQNKENLAAVQKRCQEREDKLYAELAASREINGQAIETIAKYAEKLDVIQRDITEIKEDIIKLTVK